MTSDGAATQPVTDAARQQPRRPLVGLILHAERRLRANMEIVLRPVSLTPPEWSVLYNVWRFGPQSSAELARRAYVTPQAVGQIIADLEGRGVLERHPDPAHGRKRLAQPTQAGRELAEQCIKRLGPVEEHFLSALNPRERTYFLELLDACVEHLAKHPFAAYDDLG